MKTVVVLNDLSRGRKQIKLD